jgi:RNA polymerase sigma factor (sigma-70 family)
MEKPSIDKSQVQLVHYLARRLACGATSRNFDELVATGLLGLAEARQSFRADGGASFKTLAAIHVRGRIIDQIRRHQRWHAQGRPAAAGTAEGGQVWAQGRRRREEDEEAPGEPQRTMESVLTRRELVARLREALGQLRGREQEAIRLRYLEGLETDEIARRWGCTRRTVNSLCKRGREHLRRLMQIGPKEARALGI